MGSVIPPRRAPGRGSIAVEAAIFVPLLLLLVFGLLEYGWLFYKLQQIGSAARQGARVAITASATNAQVGAEVARVMTAANLSGSGYTIDLSPSDVSTALPGQAVSVEVSVPYANIELTAFPLPKPTDLAQTVVMAKEGSP